MASVAGRNRRLESVVSILLLAVLLLITVAVLIKQADSDMSRFGLDANSAQYSEKPQTGLQEVPDLAALLPKGFKEFSPPETYEAANLYEKINGKAPLYLDAGFLNLFTQRFASQADESLWMELYLFDMAALRNAFSVYSVQKRADVETLPDMQFAYKTTNALFLVHGRYYIELLGSDESPDLLAAMTDVADNVTNRLKVSKTAQIPELNLFPQENIIPGSIKLSLKDTFAFEDLTDTFSCHYKLNDQSITAFISKRPDARNAQLIAKSYNDFLIENGATNKTAANEILKNIGARVLDFYDTTEIIFTVGPFVGGIHEAENQQSAENLAVNLIDKLSEVAAAAPPPVSPVLVVIVVIIIVIILVVVAIIIRGKKKNLSRGQSNE